LDLKKGEAIRFASRHGRLGSPLAMLLVLRDATGKEVLRNDASAVATPDVTANFTSPADDRYSLELSERFAQRGGPEFAYRLVVLQPVPDYELFAPDGAAVEIGGESKLDVQIERQGEWKTPIVLRVEGLPEGVTAPEVTVPPNAAKATLVLKCGAVPVQTALIRIVGKADVNGQTIEHTAERRGAAGDESVVGTRLVTTLKTPFKHKGEFNLTYVPRGTVLRKTFQLDRGGFEGPIEVRLADKQGRHTQGVTGPTIIVPPGATEFEYQEQLPPWMELARTSRVNLMLTGELQDVAGKAHKVSYWTNDQNEQMVAIVSPPPLRIAGERATYSAVSGGLLTLPLTIKRDVSLRAPVKLELVVPPHMRDVSAAAVTAPGSAEAEIMTLRFGPQPGPFNMPLLIRATTEKNGDPIIAEWPFELVLVEVQGLK